MKDNFDLKKYLTENRLLKENDQPLNLTPQQKQEFLDRIKYLIDSEGLDYTMWEAGNILARVLTQDEAEFIEDVEDFGYNAEEVENYAQDLVGNNLAEGRLFKEAKTPRYPEGKLSIEDKIKAIVPLWKQWQSASGIEADAIKDKISRYTTYDNEFGGGSYVFDILDNSQSIKDVAKIVMKNEKDNNTSQQQYSVELLVPTIYFNVETGELAKSKYDFGAESELEDMDITSYSDGEELIEWVFDNDYDTAKSFEREYPGLFKVVNR